MSLLWRALKFALALLTMLLVIALGLALSLSRLLWQGATRHPKVVALGVLALVLGAAALLAALFGLRAAAATLPPQPVAFRHTTHAGALELACAFCHRTAATSAAASLPSVAQCLFCHQVVGRDNPSLKPLYEAVEKEQPLNWLRVHRLPDHVHFTHAAHVQAGLTCATCHGEVKAMTEVRQVRALNMGDCLSCHRASGAPTDCATCHY